MNKKIIKFISLVNYQVYVNLYQSHKSRDYIISLKNNQID